MNAKLIIIAAVYLFSVASANRISLRGRESPFSRCTGQAMYNITFTNVLTSRIFGRLIPSEGLNFSPMTATGHSNRISILTTRGFVSTAIENIAETGDNSELVSNLISLQDSEQGVKSYAAAPAGTGPGMFTTLTVTVDCENPFISAVSMIAPSPDWIVFVANFNTFSARSGRFIRSAKGNLIAYDAGTDDGREFTDPSDPSLDIPTIPQQNIVPLVEDETDRFEGRDVGKYVIRRVD